MTTDVLDLIRRLYLREAYRILSTEKAHAATRGQAVAQYLDRLPAGSAVGLYGCGELGGILAREHKGSLARHAVRFLVSSAGGEDSFEGFPRQTAAQALADPPKRVLLLSAAYERGMLENLAGLERERILTLPELLAAVSTDELLLRVARPIMDAVERIALDLPPLLASGRKCVCFLLLGFGHNAVATFRELKRRGHCVVALSTQGSDQPLPDETLLAEGFLDYHFTAPSMEFLHVLLSLLAERVRFDLADVWITLTNAEFVRALLEPGRTRVVVTYDDFLPLLLENEDYAGRYCRYVESTPERVLDTQRAVFAGAAGVIYKDAPEVPGMLEQRFGRGPARLLHRFPALSEAAFQALPRLPKFSEADGRVHVVFAHSLHLDPVFITYFDYRSIFHTVERLTSAGVHLTVFNNLDASGAGYEDFVRLSQENPLFDYRFHVDFHELLELLPRFDFGWASYRFVEHNGFPAYVQNSLGLKIFTYAGAGLPVLVSPELRYMHDLVLDKGIGLSLAYEDWPRLPEIAAAADQDLLSRNMAALRREMSLENQLPRLADFYEEILACGAEEDRPC